MLLTGRIFQIFYLSLAAREVSLTKGEGIFINEKGRRNQTEVEKICVQTGRVALRKFGKFWKRICFAQVFEERYKTFFFTAVFAEIESKMSGTVKKFLVLLQIFFCELTICTARINEPPVIHSIPLVRVNSLAQR